MASPVPPLKMFAGARGRNVPQMVDQASPRAGAPGKPGDEGTGKESAEQSGYMELEGAQKDADCSKVEVEGGVSSDLGCCDRYDPQEKAQEFKCGECTFVSSAAGPESGKGSVPDATGNSGPVIKGRPS